MLYYLFTYVLGFYSGIFYTKKNVNIKKEIDSILNTFLDKTNLNKTEYKTLNNYMDLINGKLDSLIHKIYKKNETVTDMVSDTIPEEPLKEE